MAHKAGSPCKENRLAESKASLVHLNKLPKWNQSQDLLHTKTLHFQSSPPWLAYESPELVIYLVHPLLGSLFQIFALIQSEKIEGIPPTLLGVSLACAGYLNT